MVKGVSTGHMMGAHGQAAMPTFYSFAIWRFLAALLIMTYHFMHFAENGQAWARWFEHMLPLLDLFFMVSGYLIYDRYRAKLSRPGSYLPFLAKRLARLYPLHLATTGFFVLVGAAWSAGLVNSEAGALRYDWTMLPVNLLLMQAWGIPETLTFNYVSWSLSAEWFCYLMMPVLLFAASQAGMAGIVVLAATFYGFTEFTISQDWTLGKTIADTKIWGAYRAFGSFCLGALAVHLVAMRPFAIRSHVWGWGVGAVLIAMMFADVNYYLIMAGMVLALVLSGSAEHDNPDGMAFARPLMPVMAVSFGIYLWHPVVETILFSLLWNRWIGPVTGLPIELLMLPAAVITIVVALASHRLYEKPVGDWLVARMERGHLARKNVLSATIAGE